LLQLRIGKPAPISVWQARLIPVRGNDSRFPSHCAQFGNDGAGDDGGIAIS